MLVHRFDSVLHAGGRLKFHIRNPHRNAVIGAYTKDAVHVVPFVTMGATAVGDLVEIHMLLSGV